MSGGEATVVLDEATTMASKREHFPRLEFYWYEAEEEGEELAGRWAQLAGGVHRLRRVADELDSVAEEEDVGRALTRLAYHVEGYLNHVYELRERALRVLAALTGRPKVVEGLRHPGRRAAALKGLRGVGAARSRAVSRLLACLQEDVDLRTLNTHETYLGLGLHTGETIYDPHDALLDVGSQPGDRELLEGVLRREVTRVAAKYRGKIRTVVSLAVKLLDQTDPVRAGRRPSG